MHYHTIVVSLPTRLALVYRYIIILLTVCALIHIACHRGRCTYAISRNEGIP